MSAASSDTPPSTPDRYAVASRGEPARLPRWMTGEDAGEPLTREERTRLTWNRHRDKLRVGFLVSAEAGTNNAHCSRLKEGFLTVHPWMGGPGSFEPC